MKFIVKIVSLLVLAFITIVVVLGLAVTLMFDPNDYKEDIQNLAHDKAQMELILAGDIGWSLFPFGVSVQDVSVASVSTPDKPFAQLKTLGLSLDLWPLLRRQVQMRAIRVEDLELTLERDARGRGNWEGLGGSSRSAPASPTPATPAPDSAPLAIAIDSLRIEHARVRYTDARSGARIVVEDLQLDSQIQGTTGGSLTLDAVRALSMTLDVRAQQFTFDGVPFDQVQIQANAAGGVIAVTALKAMLYGGTIDASGNLDVRQEQADIRARAQATGVPLERLLEKPGSSSPVRGALALNAELQTRGNDQSAWIAGLNGKGDFVVHQGVLQDANLEQQVCRGIALLNRKTLSQQVRDPNTPIQELSGSLTVNQGVAQNPDLRARIPGVALSGNGTIDLARLFIDYRLNLQIEGDTTANADPACQVNPRYIGLALPVHCRGTLAAGGQTCSLDTVGMAQIAARLLGDTLSDQVGKRVDTFIEKDLGEKALPQVKDALRGLFK